jgi:hypothetical protein
MTWTTVMNWSMAIGVVVLTSYAWTRAKTYGMRRLADAGFILLMSFAAYAGELYFSTTKEIPWLCGAEKEMAQRSDWNPIVFLLIAGIGVVYITRWPLSKSADSLNRSGRSPKISRAAISFLFLLIGGYLCATGAAYHTKVSGDRPGHWAVNAERVGLAKGAGFISSVLSKEQSFLPDGTQGGQRSTRHQETPSRDRSGTDQATQYSALRETTAVHQPTQYAQDAQPPSPRTGVAGPW